MLLSCTLIQIGVTFRINKNKKENILHINYFLKKALFFSLIYFDTLKIL